MIEVTFMGMPLGIARDWDQVGDEALYFYGFIPLKWSEELLQGAVDIEVDWCSGVVNLLDSNGAAVKNTTLLALASKYAEYPC